MNLHAHTLIRRTQGHFVTTLGDSLVILNRSDAKYYTVNEVGKLIWDALDTAQTIKALCAVVESVYAIEAEECAADVISFVERFLGVKLFELANEASG